MSDLANETLITLDDVAAWWGVHRNTVNRWCANGLQKIRVGRKVWTTREAVIRHAQIVEGVVPVKPTAGQKSQATLNAALSRKPQETRGEDAARKDSRRNAARKARTHTR